MSEAKEFDQVFTNKKPELEKKEEGTFKDIDKIEEKPKSEWDTFFQNENEKYAKTVKEKAEQSTYSLPIVVDGIKKEVVFSRKKLTVGELRRLNSLQKEYNEQPKEKNTLFQAESLASLYLEYAQMLLVNNITGEKITKDEFEQQDWAEIRAILDNCILKSIIGSSG